MRQLHYQGVAVRGDRVGTDTVGRCAFDDRLCDQGGQRCVLILGVTRSRPGEELGEIVHLRKMEKIPIPANLDYDELTNISIEGWEMLAILLRH